MYRVRNVERHRYRKIPRGNSPSVGLITPRDGIRRGAGCRDLEVVALRGTQSVGEWHNSVRIFVRAAGEIFSVIFFGDSLLYTIRLSKDFADPGANFRKCAHP